MTERGATCSWRNLAAPRWVPDADLTVILVWLLREECRLLRFESLPPWSERLHFAASWFTRSMPASTVARAASEACPVLRPNARMPASRPRPVRSRVVDHQAVLAVLDELVMNGSRGRLPEDAGHVLEDRVGRPHAPRVRGRRRRLGAMPERRGENLSGGLGLESARSIVRRARSAMALRRQGEG